MAQDNRRFEWKKMIHQLVLLLAIPTLILVNVFDNISIGAWICIGMGILEIATAMFGQKITGYRNTIGTFFNALAGVWLLLIAVVLFITSFSNGG